MATVTEPPHNLSEDVKKPLPILRGQGLAVVLMCEWIAHERPGLGEDYDAQLRGGVQRMSGRRLSGHAGGRGHGSHADRHRAGDGASSRRAPNNGGHPSNDRRASRC
jgi:hypothetical protein